MRANDINDIEMIETALEERHALTPGQIREMEAALADWKARQDQKFSALFARETVQLG